MRRDSNTWCGCGGWGGAAIVKFFNKFNALFNIFNMLNAFYNNLSISNVFF